MATDPAPSLKGREFADLGSAELDLVIDELREALADTVTIVKLRLRPSDIARRISSWLTQTLRGRILLLLTTIMVVAWLARKVGAASGAQK